MIAPKDESKDLVLQWLASEGMSDSASVSAHSDAVIVEASLSQIEKLLKTEYSAFGMTFFFFSPECFDSESQASIVFIIVFNINTIY